MSAYIVTDNTINALATFAVQGATQGRSVWFEGSHAALGDAAELAELLHKANVASVNHRYRENTATAFRFKRYAEPLTPTAILKLCDCLEYQSNEIDHYDRSSGKALLDAIRRKAITELPGYDDAPWGLR